MPEFALGQRWLSETEPELGLGILVDVMDRNVRVLFPSCHEMRTYAAQSAPLVRIRFDIGKQIETEDGQNAVVRNVTETDGVLVYDTDIGTIPEQDLAGHVTAARPEQRLLHGVPSASADFDLRYRTHRQRQALQSAPTRGIAGGRIALLPHQLYVVSEVARRSIPRVLLADEVGLGKTIEACLIVHCLLVSGRASRVLFVPPDALVLQWFTELLRRFSIRAVIYDEELCQTLDENPENGNPFEDEQIILCSLEFLTKHPRRVDQARAAGWDMVVIDEAHHLGWSPQEPSREYLVAEALSRSCRGLLLLTATPEELGPESHFARLRLLDPQRYADLEQYLAESAGYTKLSPIAEALVAGQPLNDVDRYALEALGIDTSLPPAEQLRAVLDRYGPGRAVYRNTRRQMNYFTKRHVHMVSVERGAKVKWLAGFLRRHAKSKLLLICHSSREAVELAETLAEHVNVKTALFHEELSLLQRDRNAAWFSEDYGAQLMITSGIGGEGRNFQFCHHLVLYDLPENPEVLEQRIGRLDRIGQTHAIHLHVPCEAGTLDAALAQWFHEGLDAFETSLTGGYCIYHRFNDAVRRTAPKIGSPEWKQLLEETHGFRDEVRERLLHGQDRLLELHSCDADAAARLVHEVHMRDTDRELEHFSLELFDHFGILYEPVSAHTYSLHPEQLFSDAFPLLPQEGMTVTFDRDKALVREEWAFLTWDHPMVTGAVDLLLGSHDGSAAFALWPDADRRALLLETVFVLEATETLSGNAHRFLPATPIRVVVDHDGSEMTHEASPELLHDVLIEAEGHESVFRRDVIGQLLPNMLRAAQESAESARKDILEAALSQHQQEAKRELTRLKALRKINSHVSQAEIDERIRQDQQTLQTIQNAPIRLDAVRLIWRG